MDKDLLCYLMAAFPDESEAVRGKFSGRDFDDGLTKGDIAIAVADQPQVQPRRQALPAQANTGRATGAETARCSEFCI